MNETKRPAAAESEKMEATKCKLREGYQEADGVKRRRSIQAISVRERGPARCRTQAQRRAWARRRWHPRTSSASGKMEIAPEGEPSVG
jgi:hypothetical protein